MKITAFFAAFLVNSAAGIAVQRATLHQLFTGEDITRSARAAGNSICSANMQKITKLARVAGELFVSLTPISTRGYSGPSANFFAVFICRLGTPAGCPIGRHLFKPT